MPLFVNEMEVSAPHAPQFDPLTRSVMISLFSWRRADAEDKSEEQNGWWGDKYLSRQGDQIGSKLYLLKRQALTEKTRFLAENYIRQALHWMVEDKVVTSLKVKTSRPDPEKLVIDIILIINNDQRHRIAVHSRWDGGQTWL